jgi:pimeloyl-ACP methyl ester carboxylesterase
MSKQLHIIYIPGFGDTYDVGRRVLLRCWRIFGVTTEFIPMHWNTAESYDEKLSRVEQAIDAAKDTRLVIIGESAGGSIALPIYAKRHVNLYRVITICGKNGNTASVSPLLYAKHIAFREAMQRTEVALTQLSKAQRQKFVSLYPIYDEVIPLKEATVPDCQVVRLPSIGHFLTIFLGLTLFSSYLVHIAKR